MEPPGGTHTTTDLYSKLSVDPTIFRWLRRQLFRTLSSALRKLACGRLSKINILADKPIPAERSEGPGEQSGLAAGGIAPGGMPPVDHPGGP